MERRATEVVATNDPDDIGKHGRSETGPRQLSVELRQTAVKPVTVRLGDLIGQHMTAAQPVTVRLEPHRCEISCAGSQKDVVLLSCILLVFTYILQIKSTIRQATLCFSLPTVDCVSLSFEEPRA